MIYVFQVVAEGRKTVTGIINAKTEEFEKRMDEIVVKYNKLRVYVPKVSREVKLQKIFIGFPAGGGLEKPRKIRTPIVISNSDADDLYIVFQHGLLYNGLYSI